MSKSKVMNQHFNPFLTTPISLLFIAKAMNLIFLIKSFTAKRVFYPLAILCSVITTSLSAQCPDVDIVDLRGVPGYAQFDDLNACGDADTLSFIIFSGDPGRIAGFELEVNLPDGMQYAGWEFAEFAGTSIANSDPDSSCPEFVVDGFDADSIVVVNIGIEANCDILSLIHISEPTRPY